MAAGTETARPTQMNRPVLTQEILRSIDASILCWLATIDADGAPSVSPKEIFTAYGDSSVLIADIASPGSVRNIRANPRVCVSFVNVFSQKGFKLYGNANILDAQGKDHEEKLEAVSRLAGSRFRINHVIDVAVSSTAPIIAPSYFLYPETSEKDMIEQAMSTYGVRPC